MFRSDSLSNAVLLFSDGLSVVDPKVVLARNTYRAGIFSVAGRYKNPGTSPMSIAGCAVAGQRFFDFALPFTADKSGKCFAEKFWGKEKIDAIELQIAVYGAADSLKKLAIKYSLQYNIRCQYTTYVADKTKPITSAGEYCAIEAFSIARDMTPAAFALPSGVYVCVLRAGRFIASQKMILQK